MQRGSAVEQHWMALGHFVENVPHLGRLTFDHLFCAAHCVHVAEVFQPADDERLEKHERHLLRQAALMQLQFGADDNNGATRVIDTFPQQVLAETAALALEHVAQRLERPITRAGHSATMPAIVEQSVHSFLQHSLFVANDDIRCFEQEQVFEPVVAINNAAIKIV